MVNYEGLRTRRANTLYLTVPTEAQRAGNFAGGPTIYDPATYNAATNTRQPFPGNVIPTSRFGTIGNSALKYFPCSERSRQRRIQLLFPFPRRATGTRCTPASITLSATRTSLFGRYSYSKSANITPSGLPYTGSAEDNKAHSVTVQESHIFSPNKVNQLRIGLGVLRRHSVFPTVGQNMTQTEFGLLNLTRPPRLLGCRKLQLPG